MDNNNWRTTAPAVDPAIGNGDWKVELTPESRRTIVNKIMDILKRYMPFSGQERLQELNKIAVHFEEKIFTTATSKSEYLHKISQKMMTMKHKSQNPTPNSLAPNSPGNSNKPLDPAAAQNMKPQVQGQSPPVPLSANQSQARQQLLSQNIQNNMTSSGIQTFVGLQSAMPSISGSIQPSILSTASQEPNVPNISSVSQNSAGDSNGQGVSSNIFANAQRQLSVRQQVPQQPQYHSQNSEQYMYQRQMLLKQKFQQQQQQTLLQSNQLQSSQQSAMQTSSVMRPSMMQSTSLSGLQQNQPSGQQQSQFILQQHPQSIIGQQQQSQQADGHPTPMLQQELLTSQQQPQQLIGQQSNATNMQQDQLIGQQSVLGGMQHQHQRLLGQQRNLQNLHWQQQQQQLMAQQNNLSSMHQQQLGPQNGGDWQEGVYQKIKAMKEKYVPELNEIYQKIAAKLQQLDSLPQQSKSEQLDKLKIFKNMLEHMISFLHVSKNNVLPHYKDKLGVYEKQIINFINTSRVWKPMLQQQREQQILQTQQNSQCQPLQQIVHKQQLLQQHQQQKQKQPSQVQTHQVPQPCPVNEVNELKIRQGTGVKPEVFQQHLSTAQHAAYPHQSMKSGSPFTISSPQLVQAASSQLPQHSSPQVDQQNLLTSVTISSPQLVEAASPQLPQHSSPQVDQQNLLTSVSRTGTPLQSKNSPFVVPSPATPLAPSSMFADPGISSISNAGAIRHQQIASAQAQAPSIAISNPGISASPFLAEFASPEGTHGNAITAASGKSNAIEEPFERLIKVVKSASPDALRASVNDIGSVVSMIDRIAGSAPGNGSRAAIGEDLVPMTKCHIWARNFITKDAMSGTKRLKCYASDRFKQLTGHETSDLESTATPSVKRPRIEANQALLEEIREINQRLIDTVVIISDDDVTLTAAVAERGDGTIVNCSYGAISLSPSLKSHYVSSQMSPILPLRLLVPTNYPNCSPLLLDKFPVEVSEEEEDLSVKAKSRFKISVRCLSEPMSLGEIARTWDVCARAVISEYAQQSGGGTFTSKYGAWENTAF